VLRHAATLEAMPAEALLGGGLRFEAAEEALA
jgi:hypothetical protein